MHYFLTFLPFDNIENSSKSASTETILHAKFKSNLTWMKLHVYQLRSKHVEYMTYKHALLWQYWPLTQTWWGYQQAIIHQSAKKNQDKSHFIKQNLSNLVHSLC